MRKIRDIHNHSLWGVDDGSGSEQTTEQMLLMAAKDGISEIILTPHHQPGRFQASMEELIQKKKRLEEKFSDGNCKLGLYLGSEIWYYDGCMEQLEAGAVSTMADSRYILTEFSTSANYDYIRQAVYQFTSHGYFPILAHVERYKSLQKASLIEELAEAGAYIQVNAGSILGARGFLIKSYCKKLMKEGLLHFVASDAHDTERRRPLLSECASYVEKHFGSDYADELFYENAGKILRNEII